MKKVTSMKRILAVGPALLALGLFCGQANAAQVPISTGSDAAWVGLDDDNATGINGDDPVTTLVTVSPALVLNGVPTTFAVNENNFGATATAGQSFLATKGGKIENIQIRAGGAPSIYDLHLYDFGATPPAPAGSSTYTTALPDLMPADSWFQFFGNPGSTLITFDVSALSINLTAGNTYIFEVVGSQERDANGVKFGPVTGNSTMQWFRNGGANSYLPYGQAFRERASLNGNPDRSFAMAVHLEVPEPSCLALGGLAALALATLRRRS